MMKIFQKYIFHERSKIGRYAQSKRPVNTTVVPDLLESLRCHKDDEYPVISADDEMPIPPLACSFSRAKGTAHILALVDENGSVVIYNTNKTGDDALITDWTAHSNAIFDVKWMGQEEKALTASGDQTVCLWDVKTAHKLLTFKGHSSSVRSVNFRPEDDAVFASGSRDGHVRIWDVRCNLKESQVSSVSVIRNAHTVPIQTGTRRKKSRQGLAQTQDSQQSVTCVTFQDDNLLATGGAVDGCVKVWDVRKLKPDNSTAVYQFPYAGTSKRTHGFSSLTFDPYMSRLFASCTDDVIYCYNFMSYNPEPICTYRGHRNTSFYVKAVVSPDSNYLLSGSSDESAYIWQVDNPTASPVILKGHSSEISDVAWCHTDLFRIVTTSDDNTMRVWRYDPTVGMRRKLGQSDKMYDITGYAELTHRDIGTSAESKSSQSPKSGLKRAATFPFGAITELTPKRAKASVAASPSPSIKMWLKRSVSDSSPSTSGVTGPKQLKLTTKTATEVNAEASSSTSDKPNCDNKLVLSKVKLEPVSPTHNDNGEEKQGHRTEARKSCKRKLEINENEENVKKRSKIDTQVLENGDIDRSVKIKIEPKDIEFESQEIAKTDDTLKQIISPNKKKNGGSSNEENDDSPNKKNGASPNKKNGASPQIKSPNKQNGGSPRKLESALLDLSSAINASPVKGEIIRREFSSPAAVRVLDLNSKDHVQSPTSNLPNSIMDGPNFIHKTTPHKDVDRKKRVDWLTQMRLQRGVPGSSPKSKRGSSKFLDKLEKASSASQENEKPSCTTPKSKSPARGVKPITSFFGKGTCAS